jgi:hypothetical protein
VKRRAAVVTAVVVGLAAAGCTGTDEPAVVTSPSAPGEMPMTYEDAYRKLPMDGTDDLPITWDLSKVPDTEEVLAARRSLVFTYWEWSSTDWTPIIPVGRLLFTDELYELTLAPFTDVTNSRNPSRGPLWVKTMGVEKVGSGQVRVTFCIDKGHWRGVEDKPEIRKDRANLESFTMKYVQAGDGEKRWLADRVNDNDVDREPQYGAECTKWAQHKP